MSNDYLKLITATVIWGTSGVFVLWTHLDSTLIAFFRCFFGIILLIIISYSSLKNFKKYSFNDFSLMAICGSFVVINWVMLFKAFQLTSITLGSALYYTQPIFLTLLGTISFKENVSPQKWLFILLSFMGVILTLEPGLFSSENISFFGVVYGLLAAFFYAAATIIAKKLSHVDARMLTIVQLLIGFIVLFPIAKTYSWSFAAFQWECLVTMGTIHTVLAFLLFYGAVKKVPTYLVGIICYISPVIAIISDVLIFNRHLYLIQLIGIFSILCAGYNISTLKISQKVEFALHQKTSYSN